jgi:DNA polymerase-1
LEHHAPKGSRVGVHVVGTWGRGTGDASAVAVATPDGVAGFIPLIDLDEEAEAALASWAGDPERDKVLHDAKGPMHALAARGIPLKGVSTDTALAAYLVRPDQRSYDLADLVLRHVGRDLKPEAAAQPQGMLDFAADDDAAADEAMVRARAVLDLADALSQQLDDTGGTALMADIELPLVDVLVDMERTGIAADLAGLTSLEADFAGRWQQRRPMRMPRSTVSRSTSAPRSSCRRCSSTRWACRRPSGPRPATPPMPTPSPTSSPRPSTPSSRPCCATATPPPAGHRRGADQVGGADDGRIHTTYIQTIAATGRLSSTDPNLQNVPIRTEEGRRIREAFVVGAGYESLMSADYSQIEMRIMAHLSGDAGLIEAFRTGEDLHRFVGSRVFGVEPPT